MNSALNSPVSPLRRPLRLLCRCVGLCFLLFGLLPLCCHAVNFGAVLLLLLGGLFLILPGIAALPCFPKKWRSFIMPLLCLLLVLLLLYGGVLLYFAHGRRPSAVAQEGTVVVLGCKVNGDKPSAMLRRRLDVAAAYLQAQPQVRCIVSGGQGSNESQSEASVMAAYLEQKGIEAERIAMEDQSTNTKENLLFSRQLLQEKQWEQPVIIVSDGFHQFRAYLLAEKMGLSSYALSSHTSWALLPSYMLREVLSLLKLLPFFLGPNV